MGHYAKVLDGTVVNVIVATADFFDTFVDKSAGDWIKCSYNTRGGVHYEPDSNTPSSDQTKALRKNYAGIGWKYDGVGFYEPQLYPSWTFNSETYLWEAPIPVPVVEDTTFYWDESAYQSDNSTGWVAY
jgi:hypothetical protein